MSLAPTITGAIVLVSVSTSQVRMTFPKCSATTWELVMDGGVKPPALTSKRPKVTSKKMKMMNAMGTVLASTFVMRVLEWFERQNGLRSSEMHQFHVIMHEIGPRAGQNFKYRAKTTFFRPKQRKILINLHFPKLI